MVTCWWSDSQSSSGDEVHVGPSSYHVTADTEITVIMCSRQNCAIHSHRDPQNMHACFNSSLLLYNIYRHWFWTHIWLSVQSCFRIHYAKFPNSVTLHVVLKIQFFMIGRCSPICYINKKTLQKGKTKYIYSIIGPTCLLLLWFLIKKKNLKLKSKLNQSRI